MYSTAHTELSMYYTYNVAHTELAMYNIAHNSRLAMYNSCCTQINDGNNDSVRSSLQSRRGVERDAHPLQVVRH